MSVESAVQAPVFPRAELNLDRFFGPVKLLVIQGTPFCNLDCRYCYLPDRSVKAQMSLETVTATVNRLRQGPFLKTSLLVNWHAGEPLVLSTRFYADRIPLFEPIVADGIALDHSLQTNGTLIDDEYCRLFRTFGIKVGVSVDGPRFIHDGQRQTRSGKGSHGRTIDGIKRLQDNDIPFNAICVLSDLSVRHPDEMYEFFRDLGVRAVAFNVEEIEGVNKRSSITDAGFEERWLAFLECFWRRVTADGSHMRVREFDDMQGRILDRNPRRNSQTEPFINLSVAYNGDYSTFCPELLGNTSAGFPTFAIGNVHRDGFKQAAASKVFVALEREIRAGVVACERGCDYFGVCAGGNPSNKIAENGSFNSTETTNCRSKIKLLADFMIDKLETMASNAV